MAIALIISMALTFVYAQGQGGLTGGRGGGQAGGSGGMGGMPSGDARGAGAPGGTGGETGGMSMPGMDMGPTGFFRYSAGDPFPEAIESQMTVAIYIKDGKYLPEKSIPEAYSGGKVDKNSASGINITSKEDNFSGILVNGGKTEYSLSDSAIELHGEGTGGMMGGNYGVGAGAVAGHGVLTLKNVNITTNGSGSCAAVCSAGGTLKVYDSTLVSKDSGGAGRGSRTTNTSTNGKSYFYDSTIIADNWGALSTDSAEPNVYLEANNCDIRTIQGGYGTYADNSCEVVINDSRFDTASHAGIISGTGKIYFNNINATTKANLVLVHAPGQNFRSVGILEIKGGKASTEEAVLFVKSANVDITVDGAEFRSQNGLLLQSVVNTSSNTPEVTAPVNGIRATFKNTNLEGNISHEDSTRTMSVTLAGTTLKGEIMDSSLSLDSGSKWTATGDSSVILVGGIDVNRIDAPRGVKITAVAGDGCKLKGTYELASGGSLEVVSK